MGFVVIAAGALLKLAVNMCFLHVHTLFLFSWFYSRLHTDFSDFFILIIL